MDIETSRFGRISFDEDQIIRMKRGLIGFVDRTRYVIVKPSPASALVWYQSVDDPHLAFVITSPRLFAPDYKLHFGEGVLEALEAEHQRELTVFVLVTIPAGHPEQMTANLIGPLVVNFKKGLAEQLVVEETKYSHKQPLVTAK
jgi:flagellar assembly factor FliW